MIQSSSSSSWNVCAQCRAIKTVEIPSVTYRKVSSAPWRGVAELDVINGPLGDFEKYPCVKKLPLFPKKK